MKSNPSLVQPLLRIVPNPTESFNLLLEEDRIAKELMLALCAFVDSHQDEYFQIEPWFIFNAWVDFKLDVRAPVINIFRAWQMYHWIPDPATVKPSFFNDEAKTIAEAYLKQNINTLTDHQIYILAEARNHPLDLYEVVALNGEYLTLFGLISQKKVAVYNPELSSKARIGEYTLAAVLPIDKMRSIFLGHSPLISSRAEPLAREFSSFISRCETTPRTFQNFESDVFNLFYDLNNTQYSPPPA